MKVFKITVITILFNCLAFLHLLASQGIETNAVTIEGQEPSTQVSIGIKNSMVIPLRAMYKKDKNSLVKELEEIAYDLYKLAHKKVAIKFTDYIKSRKSFEQGLLNSDFPVIYLRVWNQEIEKRIRKITEYEVRLTKIAQRLNTFNAKLALIKQSKSQLYEQLTNYKLLIQSTINVVKGWLKKSDQLFKEEETMIKQRESTFKKAGVLGL